jgi:hypothetical protein
MAGVHSAQSGAGLGILLVEGKGKQGHLTRLNLKFEIRNPKQIQMTEKQKWENIFPVPASDQVPPPAGRDQGSGDGFGHLNFEHCFLFRISNFGFRI